MREWMCSLVSGVGAVGERGQLDGCAVAGRGAGGGVHGPALGLHGGGGLR